jgi:hypothetical protein
MLEIFSFSQLEEHEVKIVQQDLKAVPHTLALVMMN